VPIVLLLHQDLRLSVLPVPPGISSRTICATYATTRQTEAKQGAQLAHLHHQPPLCAIRQSLTTTSYAVLQHTSATTRFMARLAVPLALQTQATAHPSAVIQLSTPQLSYSQTPFATPAVRHRESQIVPTALFQALVLQQLAPPVPLATS
jgi:hypothetical protein